jgi:hypothetical protein
VILAGVGSFFAHGPRLGGQFCTQFSDSRSRALDPPRITGDPRGFSRPYSPGLKLNLQSERPAAASPDPVARISFQHSPYGTGRHICICDTPPHRARCVKGTMLITTTPTKLQPTRRTLAHPFEPFPLLPPIPSFPPAIPPSPF